MASNTEADNQDDGGPNSVDCLEDNLYLGNITAATDLEVIQSRGITHILTVDAWPLPRKITDLGYIKTMFIPVTDLPTEDLISYFAGTYDFIVKGLQEGSVLVHCHHGVSRSATIVLAYLMRKYKITVEKACELTKFKKKLVQPNAGFMAQLKLYETMEFKIEKSNMQYKMFRLYIASDRFKTLKSLPSHFAEVVKPDPSLTTVLPDPRVYRCRKCRRIVAAESNMIPHFPRERYTWRDRRFSARGHKHEFCKKTFFIEPMTWMKDVSVAASGKLYCPNPRCQTKLGSFCWSMGCLCPCGTKVYPAFYLVPSRVDKGNMAQNVQVTA